MADELKTETTTPVEEKGGEVTFKTQADLDALIEGRIARERKKFEDYDSVKSELATLREAENKRKEAELSELDKKETKIQELVGEIEKYKVDHEWRKGWEEREAERVEESMKDLTDKQKEIIRKLPLDERSEAITEFKPVTSANVNISKGGGREGVLGHDELMELKSKFGVDSRQYQDALKKKYGS